MKATVTFLNGDTASVEDAIELNNTGVYHLKDDLYFCGYSVYRSARNIICAELVPIESITIQP